MDSVLSPILYNNYTNDSYSFNIISIRFIFADEYALAIPMKTFVEAQLIEVT